MFIEKKMLEKIDKYIEYAKKKEEEVICYLDIENNNELIKQLLFSIGRKDMKVLIGKKMRLHIEGLDERQDIIFIVNNKEKLEYITERIEDWKEDFIPLMLEEQLIDIMEKDIVMLIERKNTYMEWKTQLRIKKSKIEFVTEEERIDEIMNFKIPQGISLEEYETTLEEEIIKETCGVDVYTMI